MDILYIGKLFPKNLINNIDKYSKGKMGYSNHNFENSIVNGLCQQEGINLSCIIVPGVYSFPNNNQKLFTESESYDYLNTHIYSVGFCNLIGIKEIWMMLSCAKKILYVSKLFKEDIVHVIINTPDSRLIKALHIAQKFSDKKFTQTVIIPDIPSMVTSMDRHSFFKSLLIRVRDHEDMRYASMSDGLVLLTEAMMDFISKPVKHIVMEGIVDVGSIDTPQFFVDSNKKRIVYTGTLRRLFGVKNLLDAFSMLPNPDVELWICGSGELKNTIEKAAEKDHRIKFYGLVDRECALMMQRKATILVNPRTSEGAYTKYSFPSKVIEYMLSGRSVVINKLPGIPDEYYQYVYSPEDESVESLAKCLSRVLSIKENIRNQFAQKGREFIIYNKNSKIQMRRVLDLINSYL